MNDLNSWADLASFISSLPTTDDLVVTGDMNARTGMSSPRISLPSPNGVCSHVIESDGDDVIPIERISSDAVINSNGRDLNALCSTNSLVILNGLRRVGSRLFDSKLFHRSATFDPPTRNCASVCDYCCVPLHTLQHVSKFIVGDHVGMSDHISPDNHLPDKVGNLHGYGDRPSAAPYQCLSWPLATQQRYR